MKVYFDATVLVAASVAGHTHHAQSFSTLLAVRNKTITGCVSGRGLSELYAVLTRAPFTAPIYPLEAWKLISANVLPNFKIITLTPEMYRDAIESFANHGWIGGTKPDVPVSGIRLSEKVHDVAHGSLRVRL